MNKQSIFKLDYENSELPFPKMDCKIWAPFPNWKQKKLSEYTNGFSSLFIWVTAVCTFQYNTISEFS